MLKQISHGMLWMASLLLTPAAFATGAAAWEEPAAGGNIPQLEIRQYRFSGHGKGKERLVLEFEVKPGANSTPQVRAEKAGGEWNVFVDNSLLLGAIPETLINDLYARKSRYLGALSVNMDNAKGGFALHLAMKRAGKKVKASWLSNPPRLVIDAFGSGGEVASAQEEDGHRETLSVHHSSKQPGLNALMCFPASAKVGLTVVFKPSSAQQQELQNVRINTDGMNPTAPSSDSIVCYPKKTQILATLSFEDPNTAVSGFGAGAGGFGGGAGGFGAPAAGGFGGAGTGGFNAPPSAFSAPSAKPAFPLPGGAPAVFGAKTSGNNASEGDLEPGNFKSGEARTPSSDGEGVKTALPASLLPH